MAEIRKGILVVGNGAEKLPPPQGGRADGGAVRVLEATSGEQGPG